MVELKAPKKLKKLKKVFSGGSKYHHKGGEHNKKLNVQWHKAIGFAYSDAGVDQATVYEAYVGDYYVKVFPKQLIDRESDGWEYEIINEFKNIDYNSAFERTNPWDYPETLDEAKKSALNTLEDFIKYYGED